MANGNIRTTRRCRQIALLPALTLTLALVVIAGTADAQEPEASRAIDPLRPADTSSPRDTLRSFLTNADELTQEWGKESAKDRTYSLVGAALDTVDFSTTPYWSSWTQQVGRILLLSEILNRVELPPYSEIPGDEDIEISKNDDGTARYLDEWTIPKTRIRIVRIGAGLHAGEYLFSAASVERLEVDYRRVKDQTQLRGGPGIYDAYVEGDLHIGMRSAQLRDRLHSLDKSSPRATFEGFLEAVNDAFRLVTDTEAALKASPPTMTEEEAREAERRADDLMRLAATALDLSEVPRVVRDDVAVETSLLLKELIDRMMLPPFDLVPDTGMVAARRGQSGTFRWRLHDTDIEIAEVGVGENTGEFLFSAATVARMADMYADLKDLPYRSDVPPEVMRAYRSPEISPGFYEGYISSPGYLIPSSHPIARLVDGLPDALMVRHAGQTRWQWIGLLISALLAALFCYLVFSLLAAAGRSLRPVWSARIQILAPVLAVVVIDMVVDYSATEINITGDVLMMLRTIGEVAVLLLVALMIWRILAALAETVIASPRIADQSIDARLIRLVSKLMGVVIAVWIVVAGLKEIGINAMPLLAGLGIGGLAVALAIKPTLENLICGMILYTDKPVRVGDLCAFGGAIRGWVENIGLRSTQIRGLDRTLISIPNAQFANMEIINWASCDRMLIQTTIGLRYETEPDQLRHVLVKIREMFFAHPRIERHTVRVRFTGYGPSSFNISIRVYALSGKRNEMFIIREDVFLRIIDIVHQAGTGFAFPSQTLYMGRDHGLDAERQKAAVQEVESWRDAGRLPFPELTESQIDELEGTLDYPPSGSPEAAPR